MAQFLLSVHHTPDETLPDEATMQQMFADVDAFNRELQAADAWIHAGGLLPGDFATVMDATGDGDPVVTSGLRGGDAVYLGGFWIIRAHDVAAAQEWAAKGSRACRGPVEVRPFQESPE